MKIITSLTLLVALIGCSSVQTYNNTSSYAEYKNGGPYSIKVRAPTIPLSHYIYEIASIKFGQILDVTEKNALNSGESNSGTVEITFTSQTQSAYVGSSSVSGKTNLQGNVWYTGASYARYSGSAYTNATALTSGVSLDWQNSNMLVIVKDKSGKRLWSADYTYKGGWEMSGFAVNTPTEASKLCIRRLVKQFRSDYKI